MVVAYDSQLDAKKPRQPKMSQVMPNSRTKTGDLKLMDAWLFLILIIQSMGIVNSYFYLMQRVKTTFNQKLGEYRPWQQVRPNDMQEALI